MSATVGRGEGLLAPNSTGVPGSEGGAGWRVVAVSSSGGVLLDLLALRPWLSKHETTWVCVPAEDTCSALAEDAVRWVLECDAKSYREFLPAVRRAIRVLSAVDPHLVVSAGTGVAVPFFLAARLRRIPCVWVETFNMVGKAGRAGKICSRLATTTLVQHAELLRTRPRAVFVGELY